MESGNRFFQFLAGERAGEVVVFDSIDEEDGMVFICFKDGSRCNEEFILPLNETKWSKELMAEVESPKNIWTLKTEWVGRQEEKKAQDADGVWHIVQPFLEGRKKVTPIPPKPTKSKFGELSKKPQPIEEVIPASINEPKVELAVIEESPKIQHHETDPVYIMMDRAKKFPVDVEMSLSINLPSKSLYKVANESFEDGGEKVLKYIIENLDISEIKTQLMNSLRDSYEESEAELEKEGVGKISG